MCRVDARQHTRVHTEGVSARPPSRLHRAFTVLSLPSKEMQTSARTGVDRGVTHTHVSIHYRKTQLRAATGPALRGGGRPGSLRRSIWQPRGRRPAKREDDSAQYPPVHTPRLWKTLSRVYATCRNTSATQALSTRSLIDLYVVTLMFNDS